MSEKLENPLSAVVADEDAVTIDRVLRMRPATIQEDDLRALVDGLRRDRARFIAAEQVKAAKKEGVEEVADDGTE